MDDLIADVGSFVDILKKYSAYIGDYLKKLNILIY